MDPIKTNSINTTNNTNINDIELNAFEEPYQTIMTASYIITAILAFIANTTAITILITNGRSSSQLRKYLINLFITDIIIALFSIPISNDMMYGKWIFPLFMCPISQFISFCAVCVCVYTLIAIGIERYVSMTLLLLFFELEFNKR
jgi:4-amino-4-deoxy-L-arabinose transferase-like glycosyltransferase